MNTIDPNKIKKEFPKAYQMFSTNVLPNPSITEGLGALGHNLVDVVLTSRAACIEFLDKSGVLVDISWELKDELVTWTYDVYILGAEVVLGTEAYWSRGEAEVAGIYEAFEILEKGLT